MQIGRQIFQVFQRRLANLSPRNRSLLLLSLPQEQFLDIQELDFLTGEKAFRIPAALMEGKTSVVLCDVADPRYEKVNELSRRLRRMARVAAFIEAEQGSEDLHLGWPIVQGKFNDGTVVRAPLLFWPVNLTQTPEPHPRWKLERRDEPLVLNSSLLMAYAHYNERKLPDEVLNFNFEDFPEDSRAFRTALYEWLKETPVQLDFNSDLFEDQLQFFPKLAKSDLDRTESDGVLRLLPQAILGIFPQAGSYLVRDYDALMAGERAFEIGLPERPDVREADLLTPFPMDASQEEAVRRVKKGESIVVQGPPGTGKSQLISNLIADFTSAGKKVLVVSQKRAALDTVSDRLATADWSEFVANLHDFQHDRKSLYAQLARQIDHIEDYKRLNYSLDAILLEREFTQTAHRIDRLQAELREFRTALFDASECGLSPKELYLSSDITRPRFDFGDSFRSFSFTNWQDVLRSLTRYGAYLERLGPEHPWTDRVDFSGRSFQDISDAGAMIDQISVLAAEASAVAAAVLNRPLELADWLEIDAEALSAGLSDEVHWPYVIQFHTRKLIRYPKWEELSEREIRPRLGAGVIGPTRRRSELASFRQELEKALEARKSLFSWAFYKGKDAIRKEAVAHGFSLDAPDLRLLFGKLIRRMEIEAFFVEWGQSAGTDLVHEDWVVTEQNWLDFLARLEAADEHLTVLYRHPLLEELLRQYTGQEAFSAAVTQLAATARQVQQAYKQWQSWLTEGQIRRIAAGEADRNALKTTLSRDFDLLKECDELVNTLSSTEKDSIRQWEEAGRPEPLVEMFANSLRLSWLDYLEGKNPILRSVSGLRMEQMETELRQAVERKQELSGEIGRMHLREQTYKILETNRLGNTVTYRNLRHQVTKKRQIWPVRQLIGEFAEEIFQLIPCWMASPETVSALFPLDPLFDLVIFDEASQCFSEQGIPAMLRGRQVVIAGDSRQLQPSDLYRVRLEDDTTDDPDLEVVSLLDFAARHLRPVGLRGHYRSRSLDLIDFSNVHFYDQKLQLLPDFEEINRFEPAIRYLKVEGTWQNQTNETEADRIVMLLDEIGQKYPGKSIGIVTFNFPQQRLLEEKLEGISVPAAKEPLFIKNLENVQGDERDIIIFSIGYAPDHHGKVSAQFGSLNMAGGENRLNVAITRARYRICVVTSVWPEQLRVDDTLNPGPKLLKAYLEYAREVSEGHFRPHLPKHESLKSSQLLKDKLRQEHADWEEELPFTDLVEKKDGKYTRLILTDDDLYYQSSGPKEAQAYFPISLHRKGWAFQRIWSREWWRNRQ